MLNWLKSILGWNTDNKAPPTTLNEENDLLEAFEVFLATRLQKFRPSVCDAFANLFDQELPEGTNGIHIEVFLDDPGFSFRVFGKGNDNTWADEPEAIQQFNSTIDALWPIVTEDELDDFTVWENDPKWGRQVALEQPTDKLNLPELVLPWFKDMICEMYFC